jgi:uncharacterized protein YjiS (DUF1127 family)
MLDFIGQTLHVIGDRFEGWRNYRRAYNELQSLDDRALADIGVTRTEIPFLLTRPHDETRARSNAANENARRAAA